MRTLFFLLLVLVLKCVNFKAYFNTFYNAKKYFKQAEKVYFKNQKKLTPDAKVLYEKALEKFLKIAKFYPQSGYLDDALFYAGIISLRIEEQRNAIKKWEELKSIFPNNPYTHAFTDSLLVYFLKKEDLDNVFFVLSLYENKNSFPYFYYKAKFFELKEEYDSAIFYSKKLLKEDNIFKEKAIFIYVKSALEKDMPDSALFFLNKIRKKEKDKELFYLLAKAYFEKGEYDRAVEIIKDFDPEFKDYDMVKLLIEIYEIKDSVEKIEDVVESFIEKGDDILKKQEIGLYLARLYLNRNDMTSLKEILERVKNLAVGSEQGIKAKKWLDLIEKEKNLEQEKDPENILKIAESYYVELGFYNKTIEFLEYLLSKFPDFEKRGRIFYFLFFLYFKIRNDTLMAKKYLSNLENCCKESIYYGLARDLFKTGKR